MCSNRVFKPSLYIFFFVGKLYFKLQINIKTNITEAALLFSAIISQ